MGLIKAALGSVVGTLSETWKDYFVCDSMNDDTLMVKATKRGGGGSGEVITNGSGIVVADGQCALVVSDGVVVEVAMEPGNYTFDSASSPSIFDGGWSGISNTFKDMLGRFIYGGDVNKSQRVYYVNTKHIGNNLFGTPTPVPFRLIDKNIGLDVDVPVRCNGEYVFQIVNPLLFYKNVAGNKASGYYKEDLASTMRSDILQALQPALAKIAREGVRYSEVPEHSEELRDALNEVLNEKWGALRGISIVSLNVNSVTASKEDEEKIRNLQMAAVNKNEDMAKATMISAKADAIRDAAKNPNGPQSGFVAYNMADNAVNDSVLFTRSGNQSQQTGDVWTCECGNVNTTPFCPKCGRERPAAQASAYCPHCGKPVPAGSNFCPHCGKQL